MARSLIYLCFWTAWSLLNSQRLQYQSYYWVWYILQNDFPEPLRLIHKNVTRNDEANNDWDLWKREGKSPSEVQNKWLKNVHKCLRSLPCLSIPASPSSANWATSTEMQFPHSHQGLFNFFTPEVGQSVRFWFRPQARVSEEMADMIMVVDMGEVVN